MKKLILWGLMICMLAAALPAGAEEVADRSADDIYLAGEGCDFEFILLLHPEAFSEKIREHMEGYDDLLRSLRFQGSLTWTDVISTFDLQLSIIPNDTWAEPIDLHIRGAKDLFFIRSNLMGDRAIALENSSLLEFCTKMSEHLGIPLQYLALAFPYTWEYGLGLPLQDWEGFLASETEDGVFPADRVHYLWECWDYRLWFDEPLNILISAVAKDAELDEAFRAMVAEIPEYFETTLAQEQEIRVQRREDGETWTAAGGEFYSETHTENSLRMETNLPRMRTGYQPIFSYETSVENDRRSGRLIAQLLATDEVQRDLVNLQASYLSFPVTWPADSQSLLSVNLTGGVLPNAGVSVYLDSEEDGAFRVDVRKPTVDMELGALMLSAEGKIIPKEDVQVRAFDIDDGENALYLLTANDHTIQEFLPGIRTAMAKGLIKFLVGIPTSACQAIMDDLTDLGVFNVLLGE